MNATFFLDVIDKVCIIPFEAALQPADLFPLPITARSMSYVQVGNDVGVPGGSVKKNIHQSDKFNPGQIVKPALAGIVALDDCMDPFLAHAGLPGNCPEAPQLPRMYPWSGSFPCVYRGRFMSV